jgi:hypothetical protein
MVKQDIEKGTLKDWGAFVGEVNGYVIAEGTEVEIGNMVQRYVPYVVFKTYPIASVDQLGEIVQGLAK